METLFEQLSQGFPIEWKYLIGSDWDGNDCSPPFPAVFRLWKYLIGSDWDGNPYFLSPYPRKFSGST